MTAKEFFEQNRGKYFYCEGEKVRIVGYNDYSILTGGETGWNYDKNMKQGIRYIDESLVSKEDKLWFTHIKCLTPIEQPELELCKILEGCEGVELWSDIFGKCRLLNIKGDCSYKIEVQVIDKNDDENGFECFTTDGRFYERYPNGKCMLWPSETNRDWSTFVKPNKIKDGTPVMCKMLSVFGWSLRKFDETIIKNYKWIVPVSEFDFTDFDSNKSKSII